MFDRMPSSDDLGPAPHPAPVVLTTPQQRVLDVVTAAPQPATLAELACRLGGHPNTTRQHLDALVALGLLGRETLPTTGRGRPAHGYRLASTGRQMIGGGNTPSAYGHLIEALLDHLAQTGLTAEQARSIGEAWRAASTAGAPSAGDDISALLAELGFDPEPDPAGEPLLRLRTCPVLEAAKRHPDIICALHQGLIDATVSRSTLAGNHNDSWTQPLLVPFAEPGACLVVQTR